MRPYFYKKIYLQKWWLVDNFLQKQDHLTTILHIHVYFINVILFDSVFFVFHSALGFGWPVLWATSWRTMKAWTPPLPHFPLINHKQLGPLRERERESIHDSHVMLGALWGCGAVVDESLFAKCTWKWPNQWGEVCLFNFSSLLWDPPAWLARTRHIFYFLFWSNTHTTLGMRMWIKLRSCNHTWKVGFQQIRVRAVNHLL